MEKYFFKIIFILTLVSLPLFSIAAEINFFPEKVIQGEPVLITLNDVASLSEVKSAFVGKTPINFFLWQGEAAAFYGADLNKAAGTSTVSVLLSDGTKLTKDFYISKRPKIESTVPIPEKLGGNTKAAATKLVKNLINEQEIIGKISGVVKPKSFWKEKFVYPVSKPVVTDNYGYSRDTVGYVIAHKGTDFKAPKSTEIYSINRGVVRDVRTYPSFGKTVIVDHGLGLYSMYMHLSKTKVNVGQLVLPGQIIGLSGDTGYATGAHLHLTIRLNGTSIDPVKFYELFGMKI